MELSSDWKSLFPISSVFKPPLLLTDSDSDSKPILGPLFFNPKPKTLSLLFSSPSLPNLNHAAAAAAPPFLQTHNLLSFLRLPLSNSLLLFFPTGPNSDRLGFLLLCIKASRFDTWGAKDDEVLHESTGFEYRILRIAVNPNPNPFPFPGNNHNHSTVVGYLLASTLCSVHWFGVQEIHNSGKFPRVSCLGSKVFKTSSVVYACWSPHIPEESVVLLESGALFLFDLESCFRRSKTSNSNARFRGTKLPVSWDADADSGNCKWLSCEFSWHPRILIVARSDAVFLVDLRFDGCAVSCLAKVEMLRIYTSVQNERFLTFTMAGSDGFCFALASDSLLVLCDVRKPMMPLLQWAHGLDNPCHINVCRLSELRSNSRDDKYRWASESGFCIILGSFRNCEFNLFCYGPTIPTPRGSIISEVSKVLKTHYAWELPSDLLLSGRECQCGSCLVREEILKDDLPEWIDWQHKKELALGFVILDKDLSAMLSELNEFGGFTLIRLMSSGKLESQNYCASWKLKELHTERFHFKDNSLYIMDDEEYKFPRRFKYVKLDKLSAYLNGSLTEVLVSKLKKPCKGPREKESFSSESHEILCEKLKACGFGRLRSSPAVSVVFNDISLPASIHEVALRRLWAGLPMELLQLAYSNYSEFLEVLLDQKKVSLEFLVVPDLPQLPPFFLRRPSCRSNKWSHKVQRDDALVGPVLPLPILLTLHEYRNGHSESEEEAGVFSLEREISLQCDEIKQVASEMALSDSSCELHGDQAVSLADEREDMWGSSQKPKPFCLYHPVAFKCSTMDHAQENVFKDEKFDNLIFKVPEKKHVPNGLVETIGPELFDELCPADLRFDTSAKNFGPNELKIYKVLKKKWSKWQDGFNLYQQFCTESKFQKQSA
ncbi:hypothetical protein RGQ29_030304 [Quercus rubra]|uniref:TAF1C beta-propeller domain-containing protein n=1 Tax=Quercus rubra TaxID=3512 RepID=A0AAN7EH79_QUERU|nr:hypothetical protein RGQ29_030304 [Quercus rubra]